MDEAVATLLTEIILATKEVCKHRLSNNSFRLEIFYVNKHLLCVINCFIVCAAKSNTKTRNASYDLLIGIGHSMGNPESGGSTARLLDFYNMVRPLFAVFAEHVDVMEFLLMPTCAGCIPQVVGCLAAKSPHMISAAVAALARLLYEFSLELCPTVPNLLPSVLLLLRSQSREIVKVSLGTPFLLFIPHLGFVC